MKRRMKKFMSLLLAFSMIFSVFTVPVQASPADNTKTEQTAESETTAADDNQVNTAEEVQPEAEHPEEAQPEATQPEEAQPEAAQPEEAQPEAAQPEEVQPETAQTNTSGQRTFSLRGGSTSFRLDPDGLDVSSVSAYNVVPEDGTEVDENDPAVAALAEELSEVEVQAEDEEGNTTTVALTEEQIQTILGMFTQYQDQWKENADVLGVQLPFFLSYNNDGKKEDNDGLGILGEMLVLAGHTVDEVRNGDYSYDDLMGMIQNFYYADQYGIKFYKNDIVSKRNEVLQKVKDSGAQTFVQKLLVINDWLAHQATFDMAYIMNMGKETPLMVAEEPAKHPHYQELYDAMYEVYKEPITKQFHDQIYAGVVAQLRQPYYEGFIKNVVYSQALGQMGVDEDTATDEQKQQASAAADKFMEDNADAIANDAVAFVTESFPEGVADQMVAGAEAFIKDAEENGVEVDPVNAPGVKMTVEEITQQTMENEAILDLDEDGTPETTANQAIPIYTDQAAAGLANGILGAWEGNHIGILAEGRGVCAGYSKAFAYLVQYMCPEIYGKDGAGTDMSVGSNWKTAQDLYYDADGNLDITREYNVDMIRITFDANTSMFGESSNFGETHFWNAVQVDGKWYYVDPCYTDIYVECMSRDRVEIDGTMNHMYFMFSHKTALEMYDGNMKEIAGLYGDVSTDTSYEDSWFARMASNSYFDDGNVYYMYDSSDQLAMMREFQKLQNSGSDSNMDASDFEALMEGEDPTYSLVYHAIDDSDVMEGGADSDFTALIEFNHKEESTDEEGSSDSEESVALVYNPETDAMEENELLTTLFAQYKEECDIYPSIKMTAALHNGKLYFNLSNCILSYELSTGKVEKVKEYNTVYGKRDKSVAFGGMGFSVCSAGEAGLSVTNHPIAALTIKDDGKMYVSVATNYAFISGKSAVDDLSSYGYEFEESNYNPNYSTFMQGSDSENSTAMEEAGYSEETNDNDEFMWSAVFVDTVDLNTSCSHSYASVTIAPTCGRDGYTENRCTKCGAPEEGSRKVDEGSALDAHHYVHFAEQYYTKDDNKNWNTGECYVCTVCGFAIEEPDKPREDAEQEEIDNYNEQKAIWDNAVATAGHTYEPTDAAWSNGSTKVMFSHLECSSVCPERQPYLDCLLDDEKIAVGISATTVDAKVTDHEGNCEDGVTVVYTAEGVTEEGGYKYKATNKVQQAAGEHTYVSEFTWADNTAEDAEVPYTATADVKCEVCGTVIADDVEADVTYDEENSTASTCGEAGKKVYVATADVKDAEDNVITTVTGRKEVELGLLEHEWDKGKIEWQEATEDEDGKYIAVVTCNNCGETHKADATLEKDEASCVEPGCETEGKDVYQASATVVIDDKEIPVTGTIEETIAALGHDWNKGTITWNQVADEEGYATGEYTATAVIACNRCKEESHENTVDAVKDTEKSYDPTCTEDGLNVWTASITVTDDDGKEIGTVNGSKEVTVKATGHTFGEWVVTKEATDTEKGSKEKECSVCGHKETEEIPMLAHTEHKWDEGTVTKAATCTEKGEKTYTCSVCNETKTEEISATGHTEVIDEAVPATCTEDGLTEGKHCSVCNTVLVKPETVPATGHTFGNWVVTKEATEKEAGSQERTCEVCGKTETEEIPRLDHTHTWDEGKVTTEATCTAKGEKTYTCSGCGATNVEEIDALGHDWNKGTITWNQVADEEGYATGEYTATAVIACNRDKCDVSYSKTVDAVKDTEKSIAPTCTEDGLNVWTASITVTDDDGKEIGTVNGSKDATVKPTGHTWDKGIVTTEATCTEDGVKTYTCTVCGETKTEAIAATGHNYENGTCTVCGEKENPFNDVNEDDYFYDAVLWAYEKGIAFGTNETHFSPWNNCTRAQVVTFLWRTMGEPTPETTENPFVDVAEDAHYYKAVLWAYENEITLGKDATHFEPDANVTRGQFVSFLHRNEGKPEPETTENPFVDVDENKYYYKAVLWAYENEITLGKDATHFVPENNCTRGQVVTFLYRAYGEEE